MRNVIALGTAAVLVLPLCSSALAAEQEEVLYSSGAPGALDIGEGPHYYAVQSILGIEWYPTAGGSITVVGDYFSLEADAELTGLSFWGMMKSYGGGPDALHLFLYEVNPGSGGLTERLHAWNDDTDSWAPYFVADEDPAGLGSETVARWHVRVGDLPNRSGDTCLEANATYVVAVAGDDWADEFQWASGAPTGLTGGTFDSLLWANSTDVTSTGLSWAPYDLGHGPMANNLAFEIAGRRVNAFGDADGNCLIDLADFASFEPCFSTYRPGETGWEECIAEFDVNADQMIDLADFAGFQRSFTGDGPPLRCCAPAVSRVAH